MKAAIDAYEDAGVQGLCAEGRFEAAVAAIERLELSTIVGAAGSPTGASTAPADAAPSAAAVSQAPSIRRATRDDLPAIVALLADDPLGAQRERPGPPLAAAYAEAFDAIERDPDSELLVACRQGHVVGTMQLDFTPGLSRQGAWRATIESVRVAAAERSQGTGRAMIEWAIARARSRGCRLAQLTTDRTRADAKRFYERLGFVASHLGMKRELRDGD
ncbi:MAG: GNAT family N-acetyltransferase [Burkholderiales bacterium]|nr:MAG: GNAT family N-acetyltransferase [Burkholderiales bacterium]